MTGPERPEQTDNRPRAGDGAQDLPQTPGSAVESERDGGDERGSDR
jgi:hypothetical protein